MSEADLPVIVAIDDFAVPVVVTGAQGPRGRSADASTIEFADIAGDPMENPELAAELNAKLTVDYSHSDQVRSVRGTGYGTLVVTDVPAPFDPYYGCMAALTAGGAAKKSPGYLELAGFKQDGTSPIYGWVGYCSGYDRFEIKGDVPFEFDRVPYVGTEKLALQTETLGNAKLAGGNAFTGNQQVNGRISADGGLHTFGPSAGQSAADCFVSIQSTNFYSALTFQSCQGVPAGPMIQQGTIYGQGLLRFPVFDFNNVSGSIHFATLDASGLNVAGPVTVPTETYGPSWAGNLTAPTKAALYSRIGALEADIAELRSELRSLRR
jgi:hypothetical protein